MQSTRLREMQEIASGVAMERIAPHAEFVDREAAWPAHSFEALAEAGLMGLHVPRRLGGEEQGLEGLLTVTETIAKACASSAMCYAMHCVGTAVVAAKATPYQQEHYLRAIAAGEHVTSLALSETGTGSHFYLSNTELRREDDAFVVDGTKQFVTNGGRADSYVVSTMASTGGIEAGEFSCILLDAGTPGMEWLEPWSGVGMRGNASRGVRLNQVRAPLRNLLGEEGDEVWYVFEVVAPYFLMAMCATYLGVAQAALERTLEHLRTRRYAHSGDTLAEVPVLQHRVAQMWTAVERSRQLVLHAARLGDVGDPEALPALLVSKADVADMAVWVTNEAMTLCGGMAYREGGPLSRLLRDARASHVMAPTTDVLRQWAGRSLLGMPLL